MTDDSASNFHSSIGPRSLVGQWIRAGALERIDQRDRIRQSIKNTGGFTVGRAEVVFRTFGAAIQRWWPTGPLADVHRVIHDFVDYYEPHERFQPIEVEALVRSARGEITFSDQIDPKRRFLISHLFFLFVCVENELSQHVIDGFIAEGERDATAAGYAIMTTAETAIRSSD